MYDDSQSLLQYLYDDGKCGSICRGNDDFTSTYFTLATLAIVKCNLLIAHVILLFFLASKCVCKEEKIVSENIKQGKGNKVRNREILCEQNGKFVPSGGCAGDEWCTGPVSSKAAECGKAKLCEKSMRNTLSNLRAHDYIRFRPLQHVHERNYL